MATPLTPVGDEFLATAGLVLTADITVPHSPEQVWEAMISNAMGSWMPVLDRARWTSTPPQTVGARRTVRLLRAITLDEEYYRIDPLRRMTFRVTRVNVPLISGWVEDMSLMATTDGGTEITWTMGIDNRLLRVVHIPRWLLPRIESAC